jgi:hypothetical protein
MGSFTEQFAKYLDNRHHLDKDEWKAQASDIASESAP